MSAVEFNKIARLQSTGYFQTKNTYFTGSTQKGKDVQ